MIDLFLHGGVLFMSLLTLLLIALIVASFKFKSWVKEIGLLAVSTGVLGQLIGLYGAFQAIQAVGSVSTDILLSGLLTSSISTIYGTCIFILSIGIRRKQKP